MGGELAADVAGDDSIDDDLTGREVLAQPGEIGGEGSLCAAIDEIALAAAHTGEGGEADDALEPGVAAVGGDEVEYRDRACVEDVDHTVAALPTQEGFVIGDLEA